MEVLSRGNTPKEMARKLDEYLRAGVHLVWHVNPKKRTVRVYTARDRSVLLRKDDILDGGDVLPGFAFRSAIGSPKPCEARHGQRRPSRLCRARPDPPPDPTKPGGVLHVCRPWRNRGQHKRLERNKNKKDRVRFFLNASNHSWKARPLVGFTDNLAKAGDDGNNLNPIDGGPFADSAYGGAVATIASSLTVTNFYGNRAIGGSSVAGTGGTAVGGAISSDIFASTTLTNVTVIRNQAIGGSGGPGYEGGTGFGGGLYNGVDSTAAVTDSTFSGNLAKGGSGGSGASGAEGPAAL